MADNKKTEDRIIIDQLGAIVILFGIIEICWGMYAAPKGQFKLNCGLLLLGLVILFGNLRIVSGVRWLGWLGLAPAIAGLLSVFFTTPAGLIQTALRLAPLQFLADQVPGLVAFAIVILVIRQLGSAPVLAARASTGCKPRDMRIPFALGVVLAAVLEITAAMALTGDNARRAERLVAERMGPNYQYHTVAIGVSSGRENYVQASVQAWNENELLLIPVRWEN